MNSNGNVPIIGGGKQKAGVQTVGVLILDLDENGEYEPDKIVVLPNGAAAAVPGRHNFVTATDLVEMIRAVVREELDRPKPLTLT